MAVRLYLLTFFVLSVILSFSEAKWVEGNLNTNTNWEFLGRFCFLSTKGSLVYKFDYPVDYGTQEILLYYDDSSQWPAVYKSNKNCSAKVSVLNPANHQIISLNTSFTQTSRYSGCSVYTHKNKKDYYNCTGSRTFRSMRERWWYVAVSRCSQSKSGPLSPRKWVGVLLDPTWPRVLVKALAAQGLNLYYSMHMTNAEDDDDVLHYEFSADEFYILPIDIAFFLAYIVIVFVSIVCAVVLRNRQLFHTTYKMYMAAVGLWTFHLFLMCIVYGRYSKYGRNERGTKVAARVFSSASEIIYLLMLILMAKGYTITRGKLSSLGSVKLTIFGCVYTVVYAVLLVWEANFFDPGLVLYIYESPPGYGLVAMRLIGWAWFTYSIFFTLKNYPGKGSFYYPFFIFYTLWFWAGPIVILIAMHVINQWAREKTVNGVEQFVSILGHLFFLVLTRPSAANSNFPFHIRTSQIGIMTGEENQNPEIGEQGGNMNHFGSHSYGNCSTFGGTAPDFTGLFLVSNTRSEKNGQLPSLSAETTSALPPLGSNLTSNGVLPPIRGDNSTSETEPTAPPSYEALFRANNA